MKKSKYLLVIILAAQISYLLLWDSEKLLTHNRFIDDAFYYTKIAENFWIYGFFTLDGEMATNGFQPLWMMVLLPFAGSLKALTLISFLFFMAAFAVLISRLNLGESIFLSVLFINPFFQEICLKGIETPLLLLLLALFYSLQEQTLLLFRQ